MSRNASYEGLAQERMLDKDPHGHADESHHSRLLTKKQISDMAFGIRELSKKLSQIRLKLHVRNVFILAKAHDETLIKHTRETVDWLLTKDPNYTVYVEETLEHNKLFDTKSLLQKDSFEGRLKFWTTELCHDKPQTFDIALAVSSPHLSRSPTANHPSSAATAPSSTHPGSSSASYPPSSPSPSAPSASSPNSTTSNTPSPSPAPLTKA